MLDIGHPCWPAWINGRNAWMLGVPMGENPYHHMDEEYFFWKEGYKFEEEVEQLWRTSKGF